MSFRVRKAGYSMRHTFEEFVTRYHMLLRDIEAKSRNPQEVSELIASSLLGSTGWEMGTRRIFLKVRKISKKGISKHTFSK